MHILLNLRSVHSEHIAKSSFSSFCTCIVRKTWQGATSIFNVPCFDLMIFCHSNRRVPVESLDLNMLGNHVVY